jgi:hypothetical protein
MIYQLILLSVTILCLFTTTNAQWTKIPGPLLQTGKSDASTKYNVSVRKPNSKYIYALTGMYGNGKIYRSRDLGKNWELIFSDDSLSKLVEVEYVGHKQGLSISDLIVINDDSIYCYKSSALAFSYNSGKTWSYRKTPNFENSMKYSIQIHDQFNYRPNFGILSDGTFIGMTKKGDIFKSTSNGKYWSPLILQDTSYKEICELNNGKLIVSGNKCLVYFPLHYYQKDVSDNIYFLSEDNAKSFNKYTFPREYSTVKRSNSDGEIKFYPLGFENDEFQWYKEERINDDNQNGAQHSVIMKSKDSSRELKLPPFNSMYYMIIMHCIMNVTEIDNKFLFPFDGNLYCYDKIDTSLHAVADMIVNNFDKSFLTNSPEFPNGGRWLERHHFFWSPSTDEELMLKRINDLNENTNQKQKEREKAEQQKEKKIKSLVDWIRTTGNSTLFNFFYDGLKFKVQKVEFVGDDKIRIKIVQAELSSNNNPAIFQGVELIQGANFVIDIVYLAVQNK